MKAKSRVPTVSDIIGDRQTRDIEFSDNEGTILNLTPQTEPDKIVAQEIAKQAAYGYEPSYSDFVIAGQQAMIKELAEQKRTSLEFAYKLAKRFIECGDSRIFFEIQQVFGDIEWDEAKDILNTVISQTNPAKLKELGIKETI
jgi:hypothetical protein